MAEDNASVYLSHCPVCDSSLLLDRDVGYRCPECGWDESVELGDDEEWILPDERGD